MSYLLSLILLFSIAIILFIVAYKTSLFSLFLPVKPCTVSNYLQAFYNKDLVFFKVVSYYFQRADNDFYVIFFKEKRNCYLISPCMYLRNSFIKPLYNYNVKHRDKYSMWYKNITYVHGRSIPFYKNFCRSITRELYKFYSNKIWHSALL